MDIRTLTPERWLISGLRRAESVNSATISFINVGTVTSKWRVAELLTLRLHDRDLFLDHGRIMRANLGTVAILQAA